MAKKPTANPTAGGLPQIDGNLVNKHKTAVNSAKSKLDAATMANATAWQAVERDGVPTKPLKAALRMHRMEPDDARRLWLMTGAMYEAMNPGVLGQVDLFAIVAPADDGVMNEARLAEIEAAGRYAGGKGEKGLHDHGYEAGTEQAERWERGWRLGMSENVPTASNDGVRETVTPSTGRAGPQQHAPAGEGSIPTEPHEAPGATGPAAPIKAKSELKPKGPKAAKPSAKASPKKAAAKPSAKASPKKAALSVLDRAAIDRRQSKVDAKPKASQPAKVEAAPEPVEDDADAHPISTMAPVETDDVPNPAALVM